MGGRFLTSPESCPKQTQGRRNPARTPKGKIKYEEEKKTLQSFAFLTEKVLFENSSSTKSLA